MTFETYTLDELVSIKYGKNQKKVLSDTGTVPIYGTGGLMGYATEALYDKPSVLIGRKGTIEKIRYVDHPFWTVDTLFYTIVNESIVVPQFLYYTMLQLDLLQYNEGTTIPSLRTETLNRIELQIPSIDNQKRILRYLATIDNKITLNTAINENLEQQIGEYFKEMFPDVLNENGKETLGKLISFSNGKKRPDEEGQIPVYGGNGVLAYTNKANASNCVIIGRVGAYCGNVCLSLDDCWISDNAISAKSKISKSQLFVFSILKNAHLPNRHIGSGQPLMTQGILNAIPCIVPKEKEIVDFEGKMIPLHNMISVNNQENQRLAALRDTLLPKLMNGEIDVSAVRI